MTHLGVARLVRDHVERNGRIWDLVVDGRRQALMLQRQQGEYGFHGAGGRERMADHGLVRGDGNCLRAIAEPRRYAEIFDLVVLWRPGAMRIDVVDVVGREAGILDGVADAADDSLAVGARAGAMEGIRHLAAARQYAEDFRPA